MADKWLTTTEARKLTGYHLDHIRRLIKSGKVKGQKFGQVWQVDRTGLLAYMRRMEKKGAKRGPKIGA